MGTRSSAGVESSEHQRLALDELETGAEIARLAELPGHTRPRARHACFIDRRGPAVDFDDAPSDVPWLGISLVQRDEAHEEAGSVRDDE